MQQSQQKQLFSYQEYLFRGNTRVHPAIIVKRCLPSEVIVHVGLVNIMVFGLFHRPVSMLE